MSVAQIGAGVENEVALGRPAQALARWIKGYQGFSWSGTEPGLHRGLPSGNLVFIVSLSAPTNVVGMPGVQSPGQFHALFGGLHTKPAVIAHPGCGAGIEVEITPLGCRSLFGLPAGALANTIVELDDVLGALGAQLVERANAAPTWPARFAVVDDVLTQALGPPRPPAPEVEQAWDLLVRSAGRIRIDRVAAETGWSRRHLSARFRAEFGITPKTASRIARFERTCTLLDRGQSLAETAVAGGYYDQAHLTNEWRDLAGVTPVAWLADNLRDRRDGAEAP